ncbi:hypothetical protein A7982_13101 [Minicystis rosea]|nr:hypothetical protein A7982_13101 [Minicystis rosea]
MTTKADYTNEEWDLLCSGPTLAGLGVTLLDPGLVSGLQEGAAISRAIHEAKGRYADNALVQAIVADFEGKGDHVHALPEGTTSASVLEKLVQIDGILDAKSKKGDTEANEGLGYRNFLYQVADKAANASGGFLGLGDKVSEEEAYYLKKLKDILFRDQA